jgi:hypothetical protein
VTSPNYHADVCSKCDAVRPVAEFYEDGADWSGGRPVCRACRAESARPTGASALAALEWGATPAKYRRALMLHLEAEPGTPFSEAVRAAGLPAKWGLRTILDQSADCRRILRQLLRDARLDEPLVVRKLGVLMHAMKPQWNPANAEWDFFPDYTTQSKAVELLTKLLGHVADKTREGPTTPTIIIASNIGQGQVRLRPHGQTYTLDAETGAITDGDDGPASD